MSNVNRIGSGNVYLKDACTTGNCTARLNKQYADINYLNNDGNSTYHGVTFGIDSRDFLTRGLLFNARYTWATAKDNLSSTLSEGANNFNFGFLDPFNPNLDKGYADYDIRHRLVISGVWDIPYTPNFKPSTYLSHPYAIVSVSVICAETDELAEGLKLAGDLTALRRQRGERGAPPTVEEARAYSFTPEELEKVRIFTPIYGNPASVHQQLTELVTRLDADELIIVTSIGDHALRRRSYELVAEVFGLGAKRLVEPPTPYRNGHEQERNDAQAPPAHLCHQPCHDDSRCGNARHLSRGNVAGLTFR